MALTATVAYVGLKGIAEDMATQPAGDGHGHSHGEETATDERPETDGEADDHEQHGSDSSKNPAHGTTPSTGPTEEPPTTPSPPVEDHDEPGHSH